MTKLASAFSVYGGLLQRIQDVYEQHVRQGQPGSAAVATAAAAAEAANSAQPHPESEVKPSGNASSGLQGFMEATATGDPTHEAAVLVARVRKLERKLAHYKSEVVYQSGAMKELEAAIAKLECMEAQLEAMAQEKSEMASRYAAQQLLAAKNAVIRGELEKERDELQTLVASMRRESRHSSGVGGSSVPTGWRAKARLSLSAVRAPAAPVEADTPGGGASEPVTPRPNYADPDAFACLDLWGIDVHSMRTAEIVLVLRNELAELTARHAQTRAAGEGRLRNVAQHAMEQLVSSLVHTDTSVALHHRTLKPLGEPTWLPTYLHSTKIVSNLQYTLHDTLALIRRLHVWRGQQLEHSKLDPFFAEVARERGRSLPDVACSFLYALQRYSDDPNCAMLSLVIAGHVGYCMLTSLQHDIAAVEDALRAAESGPDGAARPGALFTSSSLVLSRTCTLPHIVACLDKVFAGTKDTRSLLQLKHAVFLDAASRGCVEWGELFAASSPEPPATGESAFLRMLKLQKLGDVVRWLKRLELAMVGQAEGLGTPQVSRIAAKGAVQGADPSAPAAKVSQFVDDVFTGAGLFQAGKRDSPIATPAPAMWIPLPRLAEAGTPGKETRYDAYARLLALDMGLPPSPFVGVEKDAQSKAGDKMHIAEFLHVARHIQYSPSTPALGPSIPVHL